jgi:hypothetical protein
MKETIIVVVGIVAFVGLLVWLIKAWGTSDESEPNSSPNETHNGSTEAISSNSSIEHKLDRLYDVMNHIRWIGLSIGCMFALTFIVPQCTGG